MSSSAHNQCDWCLVMPTTTTSALTIRANSRVASSLAHNPSNMPPVASRSARNPRTFADCERHRPQSYSSTTSRIASGSPRNRCDHCLDCEETLPARSLTSARGWSDWERPLCTASNPWILGTIVSAAAHSPTRCRIASATARNRRHDARIVSSAARNPRLCSDCERAGSSRRRHQSPWERSCS